MNSVARILVFINAVLFILVLPWLFSPVVEIFTKIAIFSLTLTNMVSAYRKRIVWVAFYFYIIALFYNPWFLVGHKMERSFAADVGVGLSIFVIGIFWNKIVADRRE